MGESESFSPLQNPSAAADRWLLWRLLAPPLQRPLKRTSSPRHGCTSLFIRRNFRPTTVSDRIGWVFIALLLQVWGLLRLWDPGGTLFGVLLILAGELWKRDWVQARCGLLLLVFTWIWFGPRHRHRARLNPVSWHGGGWTLMRWLILLQPLLGSGERPGMEETMRCGAWWVGLLAQDLIEGFLGSGGGFLFWWRGWLQTGVGGGRIGRVGALHWVPRVIWVTQMGWCWAHIPHMLGQAFPWVWIWDPGDSLPAFMLLWTIPLSMPCLFSGGLSLSRFYKKSRYSYAVSTTIACIGEQCPLCWVESSFVWSADLLHTRITSSDCWVYNSQGHDNGSVVGNYLVDDEDSPSKFASVSRKVSELSFIHYAKKLIRRQSISVV